MMIAFEVLKGSKMTIKSNQKMSQKNKAIIAMLISAFSFSIMSIAVKLAVDIPVYEKVFFRNFFTVFFAYYIVKKNKAPLFGTTKGRPFLIARSISGMLGVITMFYALSKIDVATATTIQKLSQFWVLIFAAIFLNEKIGIKQYAYLLLALVGVVIVSKPSAPEVLIPTLICFSSSIFAGIAYAFLSKLKTYEHPTTVVFFFSCFSTIVMLVPMLLNFKWFTFQEFILLLLMGLGGLGGQIFLTNAYHYASASDVSIYAYANIIFSAMLAFVIWGSLPDLWTTIGIVIIIAASYLNYAEVKKHK